METACFCQTGSTWNYTRGERKFETLQTINRSDESAAFNIIVATIRSRVLFNSYCDGDKQNIKASQCRSFGMPLVQSDSRTAVELEIQYHDVTLSVACWD